MILKFKEKTQVLLLFPICIFHCHVGVSLNGNTGNETSMVGSTAVLP